MLRDIDFLSEPDKSAILLCLRAVAEHPDNHINLLAPSNRKPHGLQIWVGVQAGRESAITNGVPISGNIFAPLKTHGWVHSVPNSQSYAFTEEAFEWLRAEKSSPAKLRVALGKSLYEIYSNDPTLPIKWVPEDVATQLGAARSSVIVETSNLVTIGLLQDITPFGGEDIRFYQFTPVGMQWALANFPESLNAGPNVVVNLVINVEPYIQQVEQLAIDDDLKMRLELALHRLEVESRKSDPTYAPLRELLSMMADSAQVASVALPLIYQYHGAFMRMAASVVPI